MVSEAEFDKNQAAFRQSQPTNRSAIEQLTGTDIPFIGEGPRLGDPNLTSAEQREIAMGVTPGLGVAGQIGTQAGSAISKKLILLLSGTTLLNSAISAFLSGPNTLIGKEANKFYSDAGIDVGNLRLLAFEQMYTTPVEDPVTGQWTFLFDDETELVNRMRENGITKDLIPKRVIQLQQLRAANIEFIQQAAGSPSELRAAGQIQPGELPFSAAQRITKENIAAAAPVNDLGLTQSEVDLVNKRFAAGAQGFATTQSGQVVSPAKRSSQRAGVSASLIPGEQLPEKALNAEATKETDRVPAQAAAAVKPSTATNAGGGLFTPRFRTREELQNALGASITEAAWQSYLRTGRIPR